MSSITWIKAVALAGSGIVFSYLGVWTYRKWVNRVAAREEKDNVIDRLHDKENDNEIEIDRLPDDILSGIVSRLTLIEASRTSILCRRWRTFWTRKPELVFNCSYGGSFLKSVDQCLEVFSDHGREIRVIHLSCCFLNGDTCHLVRWMKALARFDVERIFLGKPCGSCIRAKPPEKSYTFSFKLIDELCKLKDLRLLNCYVETSFVGHCNSLTRIFLGCLELVRHELSDILRSCPNLEIVSLIRCELPQNVRISGSNLKLKKLEVIVCSNVEKLEISDTNVEIVYFFVRGEVELLLSSLPKLKVLNLSAPGTDYRFRDVTQDLPELRSLMITTPYQVLRLPPTFRALRNIRRLVFLTSSKQPHPEGREKLDLWNFAPVLDAFPFLEEFFLAVGGAVCDEERKAKWPVAPHKHLRLVELSGFSNTRNELEFARFILTSAEVLREFILVVCPRKCDIKKHFHIDESEKNSKKIDARVAEAVCADLQRQAVSIHALVKLLV